MERERVTPARRGALLTGRVLSTLTALLVQSLLLVLIAVAFFGLRPSPGGVVLTLLLVALLGATFASLSYALGLVAPGEDTVASVLNSVTLPLLLLSGILLPMSLGPTWLYNLSRANPVSYLVDAARDLFAGQFATGDVVAGFVIAAVLALVGGIVGTRTFQRASS
ncbi:ABC transporter permease [Egibacter rhizosphaerae]|uniref:ABC transporter permease n=1 Tax=Egibacter rhizosphaerae TaxID=1670831 RepID=UPI0030840839